MTKFDPPRRNFPPGARIKDRYDGQLGRVVVPTHDALSPLHPINANDVPVRWDSGRFSWTCISHIELRS